MKSGEFWQDSKALADHKYKEEGVKGDCQKFEFDSFLNWSVASGD